MILNLSDIALLTAVEAADVYPISRCLRQGANPNAASEDGWTPLMLAAMQSSPEIVKLLLENGADPYFTTRSEENPSRSALTVAISNGRFESVQVLVAYGADIHARDAAGLSAAALAEKLALRPFRQDEMVAIASFLRDSSEISAHRLPETAAA